MTYIDGFVAAVPAANKAAYIAHANKCVPIFKKHGALRVVDSWGVEVPNGKTTSFPLAVKKKDDEVVIFSWIEWPSKEARDAGMKEVEKDPFFQSDEEFTIFDGGRMLIGGFETIVDE